MKFNTFMRSARSAVKAAGEHIEIWMTCLLALSFFAVSYFVVAATGAIRFYHYASLLFTLAWSLLFTAVIIILPRKARRWVFPILYLFLLIYGTAEYVYYRIFNKLFSFTVLSNLHEGAGYLGATLTYVEPLQVIGFVLLLALGVFLWWQIGKVVVFRIKGRIALLPALLAVLILLQVFLPAAYGRKVERAVGDSFNNSRFVYDNYIDPHKCLGLCGYYQYLAVDFYNCFLRPIFVDTSRQYAELEAFFAEYPFRNEKNEMTGLFKGKNVIVIMMESMDELVVSEQNTPNIARMMQEGINFPNYYAAFYSDGATFANEFVMNTGIYAPSGGAVAYSYVENTYSQSLPNIFRAAGYSAESFHENHRWFYNRGVMHDAFGYEKYNSFYDYGGTNADVVIDTYLTRTPELTDALLHRGEEDERPFFDFLITYSAHLGYNMDDMAKYAYENYVGEGEEIEGPEDLQVLRAKARVTDAMLGELIEQIDEDTVIICATDHFAYGLEDETLSAYKGDNWALRQRVPMFMYCKDPAIKPMQVEKFCSNVDFLPTVANLFDLDLPKPLMGHDIFDPAFDGFVIFSNYSILTEDYYWHDGEVQQYGESYDEERLQELIAFTYRRIECNDYLLACDYYK